MSHSYLYVLNYLAGPQLHIAYVTIQITHNLNGPRLSHAWVSYVAHACTCTRSFCTYVHMHTQYLATLVCVFTYVHACMANVASMQASYLPTSLSCNATVLVTLFFPYRALAAHQ